MKATTHREAYDEDGCRAIAYQESERGEGPCTYVALRLTTDDRSVNLCTVRLTPDEARKLAAMLVYQADPSRV